MPVKVSRILHAGYFFECNGTQIVFDPIFENPFSRNCYAFPDVAFDHVQIRNLKPAAVFISHYHDDHCSFVSLDLLDRRTPVYIYCHFDELFDWVRELGFENVYPLILGERVRIGPFEVIPRRALDADVDSIFQIRAGGNDILNVVDSWIDSTTLEQLAEERPWDLVLWPFQTMRELEVIAPTRSSPAPRTLPPEWIEQLRALQPKYIVPSSCQFRMEPWSWYNRAFFPITYQQFQLEVEGAVPGARVIRMNPSVSILLNEGQLQPAAPLEWIRPVGEQNVDYEFEENVKPSLTADIARRFPALTTEQTERVLAYCRHDLFEKSKSLDPPEEPYFNKPRLWELALFDHTGAAFRFRYLVRDGVVEPAFPESEPLAWLTEVPIAKVYAALECGESLTSMYVRINDTIFAPGIESEIEGADILEDPLLRNLFSGVFGAYQLAQLRTLRRQHAAL